MYAIVDIAGQQIKVEKDQKVFVHRLEGGEGSKVEFNEVLLLDDKGKVKIGTPIVEGVLVKATILSHLKGDKVIVFKKKRRKGYKVTNGHRQYLTEILIDSIGAKGKAEAKVKKVAVADAGAVKKEEVKPKTEAKKKEKKEAVAAAGAVKKEEVKPKAETEAKAKAKEEVKKVVKTEPKTEAKKEEKKEAVADAGAVKKEEIKPKAKAAPKSTTDVKEKLKKIMDAKAEADSKVEAKSKEENKTEKK